MPDTPNLYGKLNAWEFLRFIGRLYRVPAPQIEQRAAELLKLFDLEDAAGDMIESFSHGMQQKMALAGALVHNPKVLFLDEPTVGLDPKSARLIKNLLRQVADRGSTVFFSTHILEIAERIDVVAPHPLATLRFEHCVVPDTQLLGQAGSGFKVAMATLDVFRTSVAAAALGFARRALHESIAWAKQRRLFGQHLADFQITQTRLAEMATLLDAAALLTYRAAWLRDQGQRITREAAMAKMTATENAQRIIDMAVAQSIWFAELGYHVWFTDHHFRGPWHSNPMQFASYVAPLIPSDRYMGFGVLSVPFYHPLRLVESMNLLDQMTKGKVLFGVGSGWQGTEPAGLGIDTEAHASGRLGDETLDVMEKLWSFKYGDPEYTFKVGSNTGTIKRRVMPAPYSKPHPTIIRVATREAGLIKAAQKGWPVFVGVLGADLAETMQTYRKALDAANLETIGYPAFLVGITIKIPPGATIPTTTSR